MSPPDDARRAILAFVEAELEDHPVPLGVIGARQHRVAEEFDDEAWTAAAIDVIEHVRRRDEVVLLWMAGDFTGLPFPHLVDDTVPDVTEIHLRLPGGVLDGSPHLALVRRALLEDGALATER